MTNASTRSAHRWLTAGLLGAATLACTAGEAQAQDIIEPGTRPMWAGLALGPAIGVVDFPVTQFKLEQEFGYHFSGDSSGPAIGANIGESFGSGGVVFQPGAKFWWDIQILDDMAIYVSPNAKLGYGGFFGTGGGGSTHAFNWEIAVEGKVILADRGLLFLRPIALDMFAGDFGFVMRYDLMFGGGVTF